MSKRWGIVGAVALLASVLFLWWGMTARPDTNFVVLGSATELIPESPSASGLEAGYGHINGPAISNAFVAGDETPAIRAGRYAWTGTSASSGETKTRHAVFRDGPWSEVSTMLIERNITNRLGMKAANYEVKVRGAISADGAQWLFAPMMVGAGPGPDFSFWSDFRFEPITRRLELQLIEKFTGVDAQQYRVAFTVALDGSVSRAVD